MRKGWEIKKLIDACKVFADGDWIESKDQSSEGIRLIQTGNIGFGYYKDKVDKSRFISEETFNRLKCTEIKTGDLLVSRLPDPVGKSCIIPETNSRMITGVDCTIIRTKDFLLPEFLCYYQMSEKYLKDVQIGVSGATRQRISRKNLGQIKIPIPSITEQREIISVLDDVFESIERAKSNARQNLKNAKELFDSYLQYIFTNNGKNWETKKLGDVCESIARGISPKYIDKGGVIVLNQKCIRDHKINFSPSRRHNDIEKKVNNEKYIKAGDVLVNSTGEGTLGRVAQVRIINKEKITVDSHITIVRPIANKFYLDFFGYAMIFIENEIKKSGVGASGQIELARSILQNNFYISYPINTEEQVYIVQKLDDLLEETTKLQFLYQQKLNDLEELKKSVLQKAFNGELKTSKISA